MPAVPAKVRDRLVPGVKRFQAILQQAKARDVNESDTVTIIKDMLAEVFGFDKYTDITSEYAIKGTYVDLATRIAGHIVNLIEVTVKEVVGADSPAHVLVGLDAGGSALIARITRRSSAQLALRPGRRMWAQIKSVALLG